MNRKNLSAFACRVCLYEESDNITMRCSNGWLELFEFCFGVQIKTNENAKCLCRECALKVREFAKLKKKCLESESLWNSLPVDVGLKETDIVTFNENTSDEVLKNKHVIDHELLKLNSESDVVILLVTNNSMQEQNLEPINSNVEGCDYKVNNLNENCIKDVDEKLSDQENVDYVVDDDQCPSLLNDNDVSGDKSSISEDLLPNKITNCMCGKQFLYKINYTKHVRQCHSVKFYNYQNRKDYFSEGCGLCVFTTTDATVLYSHLNEHFKNNDLACRLCDYTGRDFAEMAYHRYTHDKVTDKTLFCLKCHMRFLVPESLQFHFRAVHLGKKGGVCSYCGLELSNVTIWRRHVRRKHADVNDPNVRTSLFICDCCGLRFVDRSEIIFHLRERAGFFKSVCNVCGVTFKRDRNLKNHIKHVHTKQERLKCTICPKTCKTKNSLKTHILNHHGEKKFICEICSEKFRIEVNLRYHMLGHTKERPYKCNTCPASYKTAGMLRIHSRKHTGLKPYGCSVCPATFSSLAQLKRHSSDHTNEKPYNCENCNESFHYKKNLIKHSARAHPHLKS